jgi:putative endonuclease
MPLQGVSVRMPVLTSFAVKDEYRYWVYIVASVTGTLYTGMTGDLYTRIMQHKAGGIESFSKTHGCNRLVHYAGCNEVLVMINREKQIKSWRRRKKIDLIEKTNPRWEDLAKNWGRKMKLKGESIEQIP